MDDQTLKTMPEYVQKLPKEVRDFIFDGEWETRTAEIAKKYSLDENKSNTLIDKVLFILIGLEKPEDFLNSLISELSISTILAEQIIADVEKRIFEYALKEIGPKVKSQNLSTTGMTENKVENDIPEVRPEITPMVEKGEVAHTTPKTAFPNQPITENSTISVPRYMPQENMGTAQPEPLSRSAEVPKPTPNITLKPEEVIKPIERRPVTEAPKQYIVDPYREPLE